MGHLLLYTARGIHTICMREPAADVCRALRVCHADVFSQRMQQLQQWIAARPERCIAVVSHWGVLQALTGQDFENCELQTLRLSELFVSPSPAAAS